jgi:apolipoprotein N-acyltransferase
MDKVFITKSELTKMIYKQKSSAGPFLTAIIMFWLLSSLLLFILPMLLFLIILLIFYIPFYFVDQFILERKKDDRQ